MIARTGRASVKESELSQKRGVNTKMNPQSETN